MKRLSDYLFQHKKEAVTAPVFKMLEAILELFVPMLVARMIDKGISAGSRSVIIQSGVLLFVLAFVGLFCSVFAQYYAAKAAVLTAKSMRTDLFRHIHTLSWTQIDKIGTPTLITRMTSDMQMVQNGINMFLRLFLRSPFAVFGAMIMAFTVDSRIGIIFLIVIPVLLLLIFLILIYTMPMFENVQQQLDHLLRRTRETLSGIRVIRAFNRQKSEKASFEQDTQEMYRRQMRVGKISSLLNPMSYVLINLGLILILQIGAVRVDAGLLTQGKVIALLNYMTQILVEIIKLANLVILLSKAAASQRRINAVFETLPEESDGMADFPLSDAGTGGASISLTDVSFRYPEDRTPVLKGLDFSLPAGSVLGIIGGTGSGKTTLVNLLSGFYKTETGMIRINGTEIQQIRRESLRSHIGIVPQKAALVSGTLRDNLLWGNQEASDEDLIEALNAAQASSFTGTGSKALDAPVEEAGRNYSGGQKQRLTIARALVRRPDILILDDSSSALDYATEAALRRSLKTYSAGRTVIIVSQRISSIRTADRILVLENGTQAGFGSHEELMRSCTCYREIAASQEEQNTA
ncbi:MAG: ABC transporter ATP-binding protein [Eubacterium sp.]|nr:ABC transporter ATP-binding protein [Eubacterium sp.]